MNKIRNFFKVESNYQLFIVNIVFAVTGSTALFITGFILEIFFINQNTYGIFFYWIIRIILMVPAYQILLIIFGLLFGQFSYFWNMEKNTISKIYFIFKKK